MWSDKRDHCITVTASAAKNRDTYVMYVKNVEPEDSCYKIAYYQPRKESNLAFISSGYIQFTYELKK